VVQRGDTLNHLAAEAYNDPRQWRVIADHNGIEDPLHLKPGSILEFPPL
jgi:nucleoid-associated protein YgaU